MQIAKIFISLLLVLTTGSIAGMEQAASGLTKTARDASKKENFSYKLNLLSLEERTHIASSGQQDFVWSPMDERFLIDELAGLLSRLARNSPRALRTLRTLAPVQDNFNLSFVHIAAHAGNSMVMRVLLLEEVFRSEINQQSRNGLTPLMYAIQNNNVQNAGTQSHLEIVDLLLQAGADPLTINRYGESALSQATAVGNPHIIARMKQAIAQRRQPISRSQFNIHASVFVPRQQNRAAASATRIQTMLSPMNPQDINIRSNNNQHSLHLAAAQDLSSTIQTLTQNYSSADVPSTIQTLSDTQATINADDIQPSIMLSSIVGHTLPIQTFIHQAIGSFQRNDRAELLRDAALRGNIGLARTVLEARVSTAADTIIDRRDNQRRTALYIAALKGHENIVRLLIEHGARNTIREQILRRDVGRQSTIIDTIKRYPSRLGQEIQRVLLFVLPQSSTSTTTIAALIMNYHSAHTYSAALSTTNGIQVREAVQELPVKLSQPPITAPLVASVGLSGTDISVPISSPTSRKNPVGHVPRKNQSANSKYTLSPNPSKRTHHKSTWVDKAKKPLLTVGALLGLKWAWSLYNTDTQEKNNKNK